MTALRIGSGYDIHPLVPNRKLILGGITIPSHLGLNGHSDADCLSHAIADAILGSLGFNDIGHYFPPDDPTMKDINSQKILQQVLQQMNNAGYSIINIDTTVIAENPKIAPYINAMKNNLAATLQIEPTSIGIKAKTAEKMGPIGQEKAIESHAVCLIKKVGPDKKI
jgi:2-C-methyl-D-erythritol 2,4-cyclodiphosphate synthase